MRKKWWVIYGIILLAAGGVLLLAGCQTQLPWFGAGGVDCEWDEYDYKARHDAEHEAADSRINDLRTQTERSMRRAEEEQKQLDFGACSDSDLANHTCH